MYEYITGSVASLSHTSVVVEAAGIGYLINISLTSYQQLEGGQGQVKLYTHLYMVQDQAPVLYGFTTVEERELFRLLISVSGVGASTARIMLSSSSPSEIAQMISTGNVAALTRVKGIGPKTAEVVVVKLRDKVLGIGSIDVGTASPADSRTAEAVDALLVLGFSRSAVEKTVKTLAREHSGAPTEELIRLALSQL